jgi:hypothetical protein
MTQWTLAYTEWKLRSFALSAGLGAIRLVMAPPLIEAALVEHQPHQRLDAAQQDGTGIGGVLVLERQRGMDERSCAHARVIASILGGMKLAEATGWQTDPR